MDFSDFSKFIRNLTMNGKEKLAEMKKQFLMLLFICEHQQCMSQSSTWKWIVWDFMPIQTLIACCCTLTPFPNLSQKFVMSSLISHSAFIED